MKFPVGLFQGIPLRHNASEGVILTNRSLVLQSIDRKRSGGYVCQAVNPVGRGSSQTIVLDVKCKWKFIFSWRSLHMNYEQNLQKNHENSSGVLVVLRVNIIEIFR